MVLVLSCKPYDFSLTIHYPCSCLPSSAKPRSDFVNPTIMAQNTETHTRATLQNHANISIAELYPGVLPDPPPTSRTGFVAPSQERCHTLTQQGTQCRRRSTIHDTIKSEGEKPSLERAEDRLCEQHKNRAPGLAVKQSPHICLCSN